MRVRYKPWAVPKLQESPFIISELEKYKGKWDDYFKQQAPLHVELGTGKGEFITTLARLNPHINYLGSEVKPGILVYALDKIEDIKEQGNFGFLWFDIDRILDAFAEDEVERLYINFCDPWPKKRHERRRLTHRQFLEKYKQILVPNGEIHFKTDNRDLFEFSLEEFEASGFQLKNVTYDLHQSDFTGNVMTEYEHKFSSRGVSICRCEAVIMQKS